MENLLLIVETKQYCLVFQQTSEKNDIKAVKSRKSNEGQWWNVAQLSRYEFIARVWCDKRRVKIFYLNMHKKCKSKFITTECFSIVLMLNIVINVSVTDIAVSCCVFCSIQQWQLSQTCFNALFTVMHHRQPQFQPSFRGMHSEPLTRLEIKQCCALLQPNPKLDSETALHHQLNNETLADNDGGRTDGCVNKLCSCATCIWKQFSVAGKLSALLSLSFHCVWIRLMTLRQDNELNENNSLIY